jgi:microcin C transport system substrate-binding protein
MRFVATFTALVFAFGISSALAEAPVHAIAMHGTPKYQPGFKHFDYVNPNAPKGGLVRQASTGSFDSLNPYIIKGESASGIGLIYDSLTKASADEAFTRYGLLAETMEIPDDRSWIIFNLRKEAKWHDGKPITADDVIFTFNTIREKGAPQYRYYYASIGTIEALSPHRVKFTFTGGENREMPLIVGEQAILPKHYWENRKFEETTLEPPLGSGAYRIEALEAGRHITYVRVDDYWGKNLPVNVGSDNFGRIRYDYYRDQTVMVEALKAGEFDFRAENASKTWATAYDIPDVKNGLIVKKEIKHNRSSGMQGFVYNTRRDLFIDPKVRHALSYAFDFERSNKTLFYGQYTRTRSYFDNSELAAQGLPSKAELELLEPYRGQLPEEVFTQVYDPPRTDGSGRIRKNLGKAVKLLQEAGWTIGKDRRLVKDGKSFDFEILLISPAFERISLPFTKNLERLGIKANVRTVDTAQYIKRLETYDFDMIVFTWRQSLSPGNEQRSFWGSDAAKRNGSRNYAGISDPVVDALIEKLIAAPDRESLITRSKALDRVLQWGHYVIPQWHLDYDRLVYWNKFGKPAITPLSGAQFGTWWVDNEREAALKGRIKSAPRE